MTRFCSRDTVLNKTDKVPLSWSSLSGSGRMTIKQKENAGCYRSVNLGTSDIGSWNRVKQIKLRVLLGRA